MKNTSWHLLRNEEYMPRQLLRNEEYKPTVMTKWIIQADSYDEMKNTSQDSYYEMNNTSQDSYDEIKDTSRSRQLWRNEYKHTVITKWRIHADSYEDYKPRKLWRIQSDSYHEMKNTSRQLLRNDKYKPRQLWRILIWRPSNAWSKPVVK